MGHCLPLFFTGLIINNCAQGMSSLVKYTSGVTLNTRMNSKVTVDSYKDYVLVTRIQCVLLGLQDNIQTYTYETSTQHCHLYEMTKIQMRTHLAPQNGIDVFSTLFSNDWRRTVVLLLIQTTEGQNIFIIGGANTNQKPGCQNANVAEEDPCAIPIKHDQLLDKNEADTYHAWNKGDGYLDRHGAEPGQGEFNSETAGGTPLRWSTNNPDNPLYHPLNTCGDHCWVLDVTMDCEESSDGWFEAQETNCSGTAGLVTPYTKNNRHIAACGYINKFIWENPSCNINNF